MIKLNYPQDAEQIAARVKDMKVGDAIMINDLKYTLESFDVFSVTDHRVFLSAGVDSIPDYPYFHCRNEDGKAVWYTVDGMASAIRSKAVRFS